MNKLTEILPTMSLGDFLDRSTIVELKFERIGEEVKDEFVFFSQKTKILLDKFPALKIKFKELKIINGRIWDLEGQIRNGSLDKLEDYKHGWELCLAVRDTNRIRNTIKNSINKFYNSGFMELRINIIANPGT